MTVKTFIFNPFMENTYVVSDDDTKECAVIDAGCLDKTEQSSIEHYIKENSLTVNRLINTHLHLDHVCGNNFVSRTFGVKPEAHKDDEFLLALFGAQAVAFGIAGTEPACPLGRYIEETGHISFGNITFTAIHVPGHSPGSLCFYDKSSGTLFAGDVLFRGSIGRTDLPKGNYDQLIEGITQKLFVLPEETVVYCGHGPTTTIGYEKIYNPYL
jgi:glyoxylase-like metal-dependent hydrolase (beta-lactamase superfamily II)